MYHQVFYNNMYLFNKITDNGEKNFQAEIWCSMYFPLIDQFV